DKRQRRAIRPRCVCAPRANPTDDSVVSHVGCEIISFPVGCQFSNGLAEQHTGGERTTLRVGTVYTYSDSQCVLRNRAHLFRAFAPGIFAIEVTSAIASSSARPGAARIAVER